MFAKISSYCRFYEPDNRHAYKNRLKRVVSLFRFGKIVKLGQMGGKMTVVILPANRLFLPI